MINKISNGLLSSHRNFFLFLYVVKGVQTDHYPGTQTNKNTIIIYPKIQHTKTQLHQYPSTIKPIINNSNITSIISKFQYYYILLTTDMRDLMRSPHSNLALNPWTQGITIVISLFRLR
eukprot:398830_1